MKMRYIFGLEYFDYCSKIKSYLIINHRNCLIIYNVIDRPRMMIPNVFTDRLKLLYKNKS